MGHHRLEKRPGNGADVSGLGGVTVERGGDCVGSGALGGYGVFEGRDVREDRALEFCVDAVDEFGVGFGGGESSSGAVEGDDVCSCIADGLGGTEVWRDVDIAVCVVGLDDAYDGELRELTEGRDAFGTFGAETARSAIRWFPSAVDTSAVTGIAEPPAGPGTASRITSVMRALWTGRRNRPFS